MKIEKFDKLYKKTKLGKIQEWSVWVEETAKGHVIKTNHGQVGGKIVEDKGKIINEGKNLGRSNETTVEQQAIAEARSIHQGKLDEGYRLSISEAENAVDIKPMLAYDLKKQKKISFPKIGQRKYDGVRCIASKEGGRVTLKSRNGKDFSGMDHIRVALKDLAEGVVLDGELYCEDMSFQEIVGLVKREKNLLEKEKQLKLYCFDLINLKDLKMLFLDRYMLLKELAKGKEELRVTENTIIRNQVELDRMRQEFISEGYEGIMLRDNAMYVMGRTAYLLKYKMTIDEEYPIVGFREASGNDVGTVIWTCETKDGKRFDVRPKGERAYRERLFREGEKYIGKLLTVRFQEYTQDGVPRFPVGISIRDYEG